MAKIDGWAQRVLKDEGQESQVKQIQLSTDGQIWDTWVAPFSSVQQFVDEAEAMKEQMKAEFPVRRVQCVFTATNATGQTISQHIDSFQGTNKDAGALVGQNGAAKAFAEAAEQQARTMNVILESARKHVESMSASHQKLTDEFSTLLEHIRARNVADALGPPKLPGQADSPVEEWIASQAKDLGPMAMQALQIFLDKASANNKAATATQVVSAVTNGKAVAS